MTYSIEHFLLNNYLVYISLTFPTDLLYYLLKFFFFDLYVVLNPTFVNNLFSFPTYASNICMDCIKFFYMLT